MTGILSDFLIDAGEKGYYCRYGDFYLDPLIPVPRAVISHGHGDHASPGHGISFCTAPTAAFVECRSTRARLGKFSIKGFHEIFEIGGVQIMLVPAGHILGSAQILMTYEGVRYLYTGDYKLQIDPTCEPYEFCEAHVFITETTFAHPDTKHPNPEEEIKKLSEIPFPIMLGTYALGKAQRLTQLINTYCPNKQVLLHHSIMPLHKIYQHYKVDLGQFELYNRKLMKAGAKLESNMQHVYLVPPMTFRSYQRAKNVVRVFATGWDHLHQQQQVSLKISDHVDWEDLLTAIERTQPKEIWTIHGDGQHLKAHFKDSIPVRELFSS